MKFINRAGEENYNKYGALMKIIKYNNANDILVEFQDEHKTKVHTSYKHFKKGNVSNPYDKTVFSIGYIGEGEYKISENKKAVKAYDVWRSMILRCYDPYFLNRQITYIDCYVCKEWHCFQNFAEWFYQNYYEIEGEKMHLDKDILVKGNKIYSPETCVFVSNKINNLFIKQQNHRGKYPIGITEYYDKKRYRYLTVQCCTLEKQEYLGTFPLNRPFQAFTVYKNFKEKYIKEVADKYKELIPTKLYDALYKYEVEIND